MANIRWIKNLSINGKKSSIEIMLGVKCLGDRCYIRVNQQPEVWFTPSNDHRSAIISQGKELLQQRLAGQKLLDSNGNPFKWED